MVQLQNIAIERLRRGVYQPRRQFDADKLQELAASIRTTEGLLQPILVRSVDDYYYEIIAGERRWRAAQLAGLSHVSCLIRNYSDEQALEAAIIENVNRADLNPIEEAQAYQRMIDDFSYIHDEVAAAVGKSRAKISNALRLLKLSAPIQQWLSEGRLSEGHGKLLAGLNGSQQMHLAQQAVDKQWSVQQLEQAVKKLNTSASGTHRADPNIKALENSLAAHVGSPVSIVVDLKGSGQLMVDFADIEILEGIFKKIGFQFES